MRKKFQVKEARTLSRRDYRKPCYTALVGNFQQCLMQKLRHNLSARDGRAATDTAVERRQRSRLQTGTSAITPVGTIN